MHKTILLAFPQVSAEEKISNGARAKFEVLYRVELNHPLNQIFLVVQSKIKPDWSRIPDHYLISLKNGQTEVLVKNIESLPSKISKDTRFRFRVRTNPTRKIGTALKKDRLAGNKKGGTRIPLLKEKDQIEWIKKKGQSCGFEIQFVKVSKEVPDLVTYGSETYKGKKKIDNGINNLTFFSVLYEGVLKVTDIKAFLNALQKGIGSGKSFGFGLLSLAKA